MILDYRSDPYEALRHDAIDVATGRPLDVVYADDETGEFRAFVRGPDGATRKDPARKGPLTFAGRRPLRIVKRSGSPRYDGVPVLPLRPEPAPEAP